jgi:tryptophan synthase alpha chain
MADTLVSPLPEAFAAARSEGRALLLPYLTAGLPDPGSSPDLFAAMADAGADGFEIGIPYSDPLMDGPVIHTAGLAALAAGTTFDRALRIIEAVTSRTGLPVMVMTYANPVLRRGAERFAEQIAAAGASGLIIADVPVDEAAVFATAAAASGVGLVVFAAPTTDDERLLRVVASDPLFVYCVARLGVTGGGDGEQGDSLERLAARLRPLGDVPLVAGVGISTPEQASAAARHVDGVIVGTALVKRVLDAASPEEAAKALHAAVADLATAVRSPG